VVNDIEAKPLTENEKQPAPQREAQDFSGHTPMMAHHPR
jgi:hypothetical protein